MRGRGFSCRNGRRHTDRTEAESITQPHRYTEQTDVQPRNGSQSATRRGGAKRAGDGVSRIGIWVNPSKSQPEPQRAAGKNRKRKAKDRGRAESGKTRTESKPGWAGSGKPPGKADQAFPGKSDSDRPSAQAARRRSASSGTPSAARLRITSSGLCTPRIAGRPGSTT